MIEIPFAFIIISESIISGQLSSTVYNLRFAVCEDLL